MGKLKSTRRPLGDGGCFSSPAEKLLERNFVTHHLVAPKGLARHDSAESNVRGHRYFSAEKFRDLTSFAQSSLAKLQVFASHPPRADTTRVLPFSKADYS